MTFICCHPILMPSFIIGTHYWCYPLFIVTIYCHQLIEDSIYSLSSFNVTIYCYPYGIHGFIYLFIQGGIRSLEKMDLFIIIQGEYACNQIVWHLQRSATSKRHLSCQTMLDVYMWSGTYYGLKLKLGCYEGCFIWKPSSTPTLDIQQRAANNTSC